MMWLGIVLHGAMVYMEPSIELHGSPESSLLATSLFGWIHLYRMPIFFLLAGFFTCLLLERKGASATVMHRAKRIGLPFLIFWPVLLVIINIIIEAHAAWLDPAASGVTLDISNWHYSTGHLWFLYYLLIFTPLVIFLRFTGHSIISARQWESMVGCMAKLMMSVWGAIGFGVLGTLLSKGYPVSIMTGDAHFLPSISSLTYYAIFYCCGWVLFVRRHEMLAHYRARWALYLTVAVPTFIAANVFGFMGLGVFGASHVTPTVDLLFRAFYSVSVWFWCGAFLGVFLRYAARQNAVSRYLSDSSYWVYLAHYPIVLALAYLFYPFELQAVTKMLILIGVTSLLCLMSYHMIIRRSWVGGLLNGHRGNPNSETAKS